MDTMIVIQISLLVLIVLMLAWLLWRSINNQSTQLISQQLEEKHRAMLVDVNEGLNQLVDRINAASQENHTLLKQSVSQELNSAREAIQSLQIEQTKRLAETRENMSETLHKTLSEQAKSQQSQINDSMLKATTTLTQTIDRKKLMV